MLPRSRGNLCVAAAASSTALEMRRIRELGAPRAAVMSDQPTLERTYWLTRFVILRLLGVVYLVAFLVLVRQALPLIGHDGLLPADAYVARLAEHFGSRNAA